MSSFSITCGCNHIYVFTPSNNEGFLECGCVKCGLRISNSEMTEQQMKGEVLPFVCDLELAKNVYSNIADKSFEGSHARYLTNALDRMASIPINDKRQVSRAIRLNFLNYSNNSINKLGGKRIVTKIDLRACPNQDMEKNFIKAFTDGFENDRPRPYDSFCVVHNCNCVITVDGDDRIKVPNKHLAIVFYKKEITGWSFDYRTPVENDRPVRLLLANDDTNIEKLIEVATHHELVDCYGDTIGGRISKKRIIRKPDKDLKQIPLEFGVKPIEETKVCSCSNTSFLASLINGYYPANANYIKRDELVKAYVTFNKAINITYQLYTDSESFEVRHSGAFVDFSSGIVIPIQQGFPISEDCTNGLADDVLKLVLR